jgi:hypothetical protein
MIRVIRIRQRLSIDSEMLATRWSLGATFSESGRERHLSRSRMTSQTEELHIYLKRTPSLSKARVTYGVEVATWSDYRRDHMS